jgi:hypothetical protein
VENEPLPHRGVALGLEQLPEPLSESSQALGGFAQGVPQVTTGDGSVDLGGRQIGVSQKVLDCAKVRAILEQMCGEAMAKRVREGGDMFRDHPSRTAGVQRAPSGAHPESVPEARRCQDRAHIEVARQGDRRDASETTDFFLARPLIVSRPTSPLSWHQFRIRIPWRRVSIIARSASPRIISLNGSMAGAGVLAERRGRAPSLMFHRLRGLSSAPTPDAVGIEHGWPSSSGSRPSSSARVEEGEYLLAVRSTPPKSFTQHGRNGRERDESRR